MEHDIGYLSLSRTSEIMHAQQKLDCIHSPDQLELLMLPHGSAALQGANSSERSLKGAKPLLWDP
jgi:hypothetical protein